MNHRIERTRRPTKCPTCGFKPMGDILYGMPAWSEEFQKEVDSGRLIVGGCCVTDDDPKWECKSCGQQIYKTRAKGKP